MDRIERNKQAVRRFNQEVLGGGSREAFDALLDPGFVNRTAAPPGNDKEGMWRTVSGILRPAFPDLRVAIHEQIGEGDLVTTRKTVSGTHLGDLMGIPPTGRSVAIDVIDIVRLQEGRYVEHWGLNNLDGVIRGLRGA